MALPLSKQRIKLLYKFFLCCLSLICLLCGCVYWLCLLGFFQRRGWSWQQLSISWQILCVVLAAAYPLASCGLWLQANWGVLIWLFCCVGEAIGFTYGYADFSWVAFHLFFIFLFLFFQVIRFKFVRVFSIFVR